MSFTEAEQKLVQVCGEWAAVRRKARQLLKEGKCDEYVETIALTNDLENQILEAHDELWASMRGAI